MLEDKFPDLDIATRKMLTTMFLSNFEYFLTVGEDKICTDIFRGGYDLTEYPRVQQYIQEWMYRK